MVAAVAGAAAIRTVLVAPGDLSRSGHAPVPRILRLCPESVALIGSAVAFQSAELSSAGIALVLLIAIHHARSTNRLTWWLAR